MLRRWRTNQKLVILILGIMLIFYFVTMIRFEIQISWREQPLMIGSASDMMQFRKDLFKYQAAGNVL